MLAYSTHCRPIGATVGAHVKPGNDHGGSVGAASVGTDHVSRSGDVATCTLRKPELVANAYHLSPPHTTLGSAKSVPMTAGRSARLAPIPVVSGSDVDTVGGGATVVGTTGTVGGVARSPSDESAGPSA